MKPQLMILPTPKEVTGYDENGNFQMTAFVPSICTGKTDWMPLVNAFCSYAELLHGVHFTQQPGGVELLFDPSFDSAHYQIDTTGTTVRLTASDKSGISNALSSLLQLMQGCTVPVLTICDYPESDYRGFMIDLARQWHPFEQILSFVDLCFLYKINYLHLHFIDSQSYTLPSEAYPLLPTEGRHYTKEQIAELVRYAAQRNITLIPEFEAPGHGTALLKAYPELFGCREGDGSGHDLVCAGKPHVYEYIDRLIGEMCEMFPNSPYIHIGGDEADIRYWNDCPDCRAYMQAHGLPDVKALYTEFVCTLTRIVTFRGRTPIVWEGFPKDGSERISRNTIVTAWENMYQFAPDLIEEGFTILNSSWEPLYITPWKYWTYTDILDWDIYTFRNWNANSVAHLNPIHLTPTKQVMGAELCAWEGNYGQEISLVRQNLIALCERTWTIRRLLENEEFAERLEHLLPLAEAVTNL